jgi:hypothetical protein
MSKNASPNEPRLHQAGGCDERDVVTKCAKCCVLPFWLAGSQTLVTRDPEWEGYERMVYETMLSSGLDCGSYPWANNKLCHQTGLLFVLLRQIVSIRG